MIRLENFDLSLYGDSLIEQCSISFPKKSFNVILGENGSGKSTLLRAIYSLKNNQSNQIIIDGVSVESMDIRQLRQLRKNMGIVEQSPNLFNYLKIKENISYRLNLLGLEKKYINNYVDYISDFLGIQDILESFPEEISGGQLQRSAIAMNLITEPDYVFLDEPTSNLDEKNSLKVINLCISLQKKGSTIFFVTHDTNIIDYLKSLDTNTYLLFGKKLVEYEN